MKRFSEKYFSKERNYSYKGYQFIVLPDVFQPYFTLSTKILLHFLGEKNLKNKSLLELGCGTGIISAFTALKGAHVTSSDINPEAVKNASINAKKNNIETTVILSDLFNDINLQIFDFIIINPPYYPKDAQNDKEMAWFCGENFEYFERLFKEIEPFQNKQSEVYMILSVDCELEKIQSIGLKNQFRMDEVMKIKKWGEWNYIYKIEQV
jgi:release factor glutamine methyltransferase